MNEADTNLWQAWTRRRDEDAFATLVRPHLKFASDFARRLGCDTADADDLVQQALTKLACEQTDRPLQVGLRPWLGRFLVLNHKMLRRSGARRSRHEASAPQRPRAAHADFDSREAVEALLAGLPKPQREAIVLRYLHDMEYEEIAHVTGASVNACRIRVHKGIDKMRASAGAKIGAMVAALPLLAGQSDAAMVKVALAPNTGMTGAGVTGAGVVGAGTVGVILMKKILAMVALIVAVGTSAVLLSQNSDDGNEDAPRVADADSDSSGRGNGVPVEQPQVPAPENQVAEPDPEPKPDPAAREKLIRAVFAAGGSVGFFGIDERGGKEYRSDTDLPTGPITVIRLSTRGGEAAVLALIRAASALHSLHLRGSGVGDSDMKVIGDLGGLRRLNISATNVTDAGIALLSGLSLSQLLASDIPITDEAMRVIGRMHSLDTLAVHDSKITAAGMKHVESLTKLRNLRFENKRMSDEALASVAKLPLLEQLWAPDLRITKAGMAHIAKMVGLRSLRLELVTGDGFAGIGAITQLEELNISDSRLRGKDLAAIRNLKSLRKLNVDESQVDSDAMKFIGGLTELVELSMKEARLDDESVAHLANLRKLKVLRLDGVGITDAGVKHLARLTELERLDIDENDIGDASIEVLVGLRNLRRLDLKDTRISAAGLMRLRAALPNCKIRAPADR